MSSCVGCKRNCCVNQGGKKGITLDGLDCVKLIVEAQNNSSFSIKKGMFSSRIYYNGKSFADIDYFIGLSGNLDFPCPLLSKDLSCDFYYNKVSNPELRDWLTNKGVSTNLRPLVCRGFPYVIDTGWCFEGFSGWFELEPFYLKKVYGTGCKLASQSLSDYEIKLLKNEINLSLNINRVFVRELLKGNLDKILK